MRAFAIIFVIINHFNKEILPSGFLGVDIFFVISGFVITSSLSKREYKNFNNFIVEFYERRAKRLLPSIFIFVVLTSFLICFFELNPVNSLNTGISALFGLSNLYLLKNSTDYFAQSTEFNVFTHTWSIGVEIQFYIVYPILIWITGFNRKRNGNSKLFFTLLFLLICSLFSFIYFYSTNQPLAYFSMPTRFWEITIGCITFLLVQKRNNFIKKLENFSSIILFIIMIIILFLPISLVIFSTIAISFLTSLILISLRIESFLFKLLNQKKIVYIGFISYSLYLWHWGILALSKWTIGIHWWSIPFQILLIYFVSVFSNKWVEIPLRQTNWSFKKFGTSAVSVVSLIISASILYLLLKPLKTKLYLGSSNNNFIYDGWMENLKSATDKINGKKCHGFDTYSTKQIENIFKECEIIFPDNNKNPTIAFLGDSHTGTLMNAQRIIYKTKKNIIHYSYGACPFPRAIYGLDNKKCDEFLKYGEKIILEKLVKGDFIVINNNDLYNLGDKKLRGVKHQIYDKKGKILSNGNMKIKIYTKSLINFANLAKKKGIKIIFIGSGMRNTLPITSQKEWFRPFPSLWVYEEEKKNALDMNLKFKNILKGIDNLIFLDPLEEMPEIKNNNQHYLYYRDGDHLSDYGAEIITKKISLIINESIF